MLPTLPEAFLKADLIPTHIVGEQSQPVGPGFRFRLQYLLQSLSIARLYLQDALKCFHICLAEHGCGHAYGSWLHRSGIYLRELELRRLRLSHRRSPRLALRFCSREKDQDRRAQNENSHLSSDRETCRQTSAGIQNPSQPAVASRRYGHRDAEPESRGGVFQCGHEIPQGLYVAFAVFSAYLQGSVIAQLFAEFREMFVEPPTGRVKPVQRLIQGRKDANEVVAPLDMRQLVGQDQIQLLGGPLAPIRRQKKHRFLPAEGHGNRDVGGFP